MFHNYKCIIVQKSLNKFSSYPRNAQLFGSSKLTYRPSLVPQAEMDTAKKKMQFVVFRFEVHPQWGKDQTSIGKQT